MPLFSSVLVKSLLYVQQLLGYLTKMTSSCFRALRMQLMGWRPLNAKWAISVKKVILLGGIEGGRVALWQPCQLLLFQKCGDFHSSEVSLYLPHGVIVHRILHISSAGQHLV